MPERSPPDRRRRDQARAAGFRPRSRWWGLAGVAAGLSLLGGAAARGPEELARWLDAVFFATDETSGGLWRPELPALALALLAALAAGLVLAAVWATRKKRRATAGLGAHARLDPRLPWLPAAASCALALTIVLAALRPALAGAARSVDAGAGGLISLWTEWTWRGLWLLLGVSAGLGALERLASARRLWQGLHLTRAQARARAQARGRKR
ncbi:hypothetical protein G6O69_03660 [Pseudenhygromyxa sp. WMMC2535]|uniref:hypothetical protein n=1 Tax=Pseudenhygromyxa sp. WMMC2535 TaxID=2712867 RepID=UPI001557F14A|nr:hypothetical protein [Pseudenhygromyxa sp. WMMC2535]